MLLYTILACRLANKIIEWEGIHCQPLYQCPRISPVYICKFDKLFTISIENWGMSVTLINMVWIMRYIAICGVNQPLVYNTTVVETLN